MAVNKSVLRVKSNKQLVAKSEEDLRAKVPKVAKSRMLAAARDLKKRMSKPGKKMKYPVKWDSLKQKIKVIIKLKRAKNLPYKRKKEMEKGWNIVTLQTGYSVENRVKGSKHVYGNLRGQKQSKIHEKRWPDFQKETNTVVKALPKGMLRAMAELTKEVTKKKAPVK